MLLTRYDSVNASALAFPIGLFLSVTLRYYAQYTANIDSPPQIALLVRFFLYQAIPSVFFTALQLQPFFWNFPLIFHFKDWFIISILAISVSYSFIFNAYIVHSVINTENLKSYFRFGFSVLLLIYPWLCRYRAAFLNKSTIQKQSTNASKPLHTHGKLPSESFENSQERYRNFTRFTPFGFFICITTLFNVTIFYLLNSPPFAIPITYSLLLVCIYFTFRDLKRSSIHSFSVSTLPQTSAIWNNTADIHAHPFKPNFHYMLAWGVCTVIIIVLSQLYVNTLCVFSDSPQQECVAYYRKHAKNVPYLENLLLKLFFRSWVCVISFVMEIFSAFAFDDCHFLHHSFLWRYMEDLVVSMGFITSNDISLTATLLALNFCFVILKVY
ncbi:hypothetical protein BKA69DRAFT_1075915 [Paraphysoderma sedebokerense]|nr:hypothetical protein BKA69DRAFT_1075915 [Paraphysoderma sedebokerense]